MVAIDERQKMLNFNEKQANRRWMKMDELGGVGGLFWIRSTNRVVPVVATASTKSYPKVS